MALVPFGQVKPFQGSGYQPPRQAPGAPAPTYAPPSTNQKAIGAAKSYRDTLGLPSFQDLLGKLGSGGSTHEFGNAGAAGTGADFAKNELANWKGNLRGQQNQLSVLRGGIANPTKTSGFKNIMRLTNERLGEATENDRRLGAEAAAKRGFVGGYNPERSDRDRLEAVATAGYEAADKERAAGREQFANEASLYGSQMGGYNAALGAYTDLTKTQAELPTKWLDSYASLLGGLGGSFGDIYGTALKGEMFDEENRTTAKNALRAENRDKLYHRNYYDTGPGTRASG